MWRANSMKGMETIIKRWGFQWVAGVCGTIFVGVLGIGGCATTGAETEPAIEEEAETAMTDSASQLETVSEQSSRNDREQRRVSGTIQQHVDKLESCYMRGALVSRQENLTGELTLGWTIDDHGEPHNVHLVDDGLGNPEIVACVRAVVEGLVFEKPESDTVDVQYPFEFDRAGNIPDEPWYCRVHRTLYERWEPPKKFDSDQLDRLARRSIIYARISDQGAITDLQFLESPDQPTFNTSIEELLHTYRPDGENRLPLPAGDKLRRYVDSTGMVLQNWRDPPKKDENSDEDAESSRSTDDEAERSFDCGDVASSP